MHETIFVNKIIEEAKKHNNIKKIIVEVGELAEIPAEDLGKHLKDMVKWDVKIVKKEGLVECGCGFKGRPKIVDKAHDMTLFECPKCQDIPQVLDGDKVILKEVIVE